jgi:hypothetical protein
MTNNQWGTYALNNRNLATWVGPLNLGSNNLLEFFLGFYPVGDGTQHGIADGGFIGASQMAFVYNDNNDGKFSFQYMHSPILNGGNESVGTFTYFPAQTATTNCKTSYLNAYSGIMFCNMYTNLSDDPNTDPFFKQMGFKFNDLVPAEIPSFFKSGNIPYEANGAQNSAFVPFNYYDTFLKYTTRNYMSMGDIVSPATVKLGSYNITSYTSIYTTQALGLENAVNQYYFETSETTEPIKASLPPISSDTNGGHYLIDLQCSYVNDFITQDKNYQVKAVVGNYFLSGDSFAMSMGPDSFVYQHKGEAISLASVKIRILNPITKLPETNLGTNSTVYLQITKEPPQGNQEAKK